MVFAKASFFDPFTNYLGFFWLPQSFQQTLVERTWLAKFSQVSACPLGSPRLLSLGDIHFQKSLSSCQFSIGCASPHLVSIAMSNFSMIFFSSYFSCFQCITIVLVDSNFCSKEVFISFQNIFSWVIPPPCHFAHLVHLSYLNPSLN